MTFERTRNRKFKVVYIIINIRKDIRYYSIFTIKSYTEIFIYHKFHMKKTKIIATIWPSTWEEEKIVEMYKNWVNMIRFNFSHADYENAQRVVDIITKLNSNWKTNLSMILDTKWPEIRTWDLKEKIQFLKWDVFNIFTEKIINKEDNSLFCDYPFLSEDVSLWDIIRIDSWLFDVIVKEVFAWYIKVEALNDALIWSRRHINLPWVKLRLPWVTDEDKQSIRFAIDNKFDFIAMSFVRNIDNIKELRDFLYKNWWNDIRIISKIENQEAIENMDDIVKYSDWVMVARWDLWIEIPIQKLPIYQKQIVKKSREYWKFVIIATHLLETMIENAFPTRAEVSDVFNSILQKVDSLMLSWETTIWKYPIEAVKIMKDTICQAEQTIIYEHNSFNIWDIKQSDKEKMYLIRSALYISEEIEDACIMILTKTWLLARLASVFRPNCRVFAFTKDINIYKYMNALFWISPGYTISNDSDLYDWFNEISELKNEWHLQLWSKVIVISDYIQEELEIPTLKIVTVN